VTLGRPAMIGEDAYEVSVARNRVDDAALAAHLLPTQPDKDEVSEGRPSWARSWEEKKRPKLTGTCSTWNKKGWGFIKRDDGASDVFVHQRSILQRGFRSLLEGERVEFDLGKMPDGRIEAIKVTGPGGEKVQGQPHPKDDEEDVEEEKGSGGKAASEPKVKLKPYTGFMPRNIARKPAVPKPRPLARGDGAATSQAAGTMPEASSTTPTLEEHAPATTE